MATARSIITQALQEIGAIGQGEALSPSDASTALVRLQNQIDSWGADRLTIHVTDRVTYTLPSGTSTRTIGAAGAHITATRPVWINGINYVVPGTSPGVETPMGQMDEDSYQNLAIKDLQSSLPTQWYYNATFPLGTLFFWPTVTQDVDIAIYYPLAIGAPTSLDSDLVGPPGYQDAFLYQLALRLVTPFSVPVPPLLPQMAREAYALMKRPNVQPGLLGIDAALVPMTGGAYNVLNDSSVTPSNR